MPKVISEHEDKVHGQEEEDEGEGWGPWPHKALKFTSDYVIWKLAPGNLSIRTKAALLMSVKGYYTIAERWKRLVAFIDHDKDFEVSLSYESSDPLPPGVSSDKFAHYAVTGLTDASDKYNSRNLSAPIKANLHFSLSRSGILSLDRADAVIEISEWVEVPKKNLTMENATTSTPNVSIEAGTGETTEGSKDNLTSDGGSSNTSSSNLEEQSSVDVVTEKKLKKRTFRVPLKIVEKTMGSGVPLSKEALAEAKLRLEALDKKDLERRRTAELKNNLEGYIYATKEKLESSEELGKVSTGEERQSFNEKLDEVQEWLYTDGEDASASDFQERLDLLKAIGDPIFFRLNELIARPEASEFARKYLGELQQIVSDWEKNKPWLSKARIDEVLADADKIKNWLEEKQAEQNKISGFNTPAFTSEEVYRKVFDLQDEVASINRIPKPKPKVEKPSKNETDSGGEETASTSDSTSEETSTQTDQPEGDPVGSPSDKVDSETEVHDEL
ncbi:heat shock 70 kDa protein 17-like [Telopea speciosissima]|uniref:heat shock 70 kDa protein 17-like n=1 Tax=Telopea speciosissima TaxID=54955 RepID=UPI001CC578F5|nr:heat shock 70 kDa protein 17-like [Telopea speciosissima]